MKKEFFEAQFEVVELDIEDVVTTSPVVPGVEPVKPDWGEEED